MAQPHSRDCRDAREITGADAIFLQSKESWIRYPIVSLSI